MLKDYLSSNLSVTKVLSSIVYYKINLLVFFRYLKMFYTMRWALKSKTDKQVQARLINKYRDG